MKRSVALPLLLLLGALGSTRATWANAFTFTTINVPGSGFTNALGINNADQIVGYFFQDTPPSNNGFLYQNGAFTTIEAPGSLALSAAIGINDRGQIVGESDLGGSGARGFLYSNGAFDTINVPGSFTTSANGINNRDQIVGTYVIDASNPVQIPALGFLYADGVFSTIAVPGSAATKVNGINDSGQIVGTFTNDFRSTHGFFDDKGVFTTIDVPGRFFTVAAGINNRGQIVGSFSDASGFAHGFLYAYGVFTTMDIPGALSTGLNGINDRGQIVGQSIDASNHGFSFVATPIPEPASALLAALGLGSIGVLIRRRRSRPASSKN
jgi:probable HAF family extracellular repeat protein